MTFPQNQNSNIATQMDAHARLQLVERALDAELEAMDRARQKLAAAAAELAAVEARIRGLQQQYPRAVGACL